MVLTDYPDDAYTTWESCSLRPLPGFEALGCRAVWLCVQAKFKEPSQSGYVQLSGTHYKTEKAFAHRLAWGIEFGLGMLPDQASIPKMEISHLCHNKLCCTIDHLHKELAVVNKSRNYCWATTTTCFHFPRCLRVNDSLIKSKHVADAQERCAQAYLHLVRADMHCAGLTSIDGIHSSPFQSDED